MILDYAYIMKKELKNISKNLLDTMKGALYKKIIGPLKYCRGDDYAIEKYWRDRFLKYGQSLKGAGNVNLSEEKNAMMYAESAKIFINLCKKEGIDFSRIKVLEIGCGTGFYTELLYKLGARDYTGIDITDVLFDSLRKKFPQFKFLKSDITSAKIEEGFDVIVMMNVIEHIVKDSKLIVAMENVKHCLSEGGVFIVGAVMDTNKKHLFYVRYWTLEDIICKFSNHYIAHKMPFQNGHIVSIKSRS